MQRVQRYFPRKRKTKIHPVKNSVKGKQGTTIIPAKSKTKNHPVKNSVNDTQDAMLFSKERVKTKNHPVKDSVNGTQCIYNAVFPRRNKNINRQVKNSVSDT